MSMKITMKKKYAKSQTSMFFFDQGLLVKIPTLFVCFSREKIDRKFNALCSIIWVFFLFCRFCVGDRFYLCENKILCEYDYEERLVFASMANHPMLKRHATSLTQNAPPPPQQQSLMALGHPGGGNGTSGATMAQIAAQQRPPGDHNNNQNANNAANQPNGPPPPFGTPNHLKQTLGTSS